MGLGFGLLSAQLRPGESGWTRAYDETLRLAVDAERLGFESVWTTEHHFVDDGYMPSLLTMSAAMAARTTRIKIGTGVLLAPLHHPLRLAEDAATVELISGGRLILGLGLGWSEIEFEAFGADPSVRGRAMNEIIPVLRQAWSGEPIRHDGSLYRLPPVAVRPTPESQIPILIGGNADAALRRAGRLADGFFSNAPPDRLSHQAAVIGEALAEAGRAPASFEWHYYAFAYPCDDPDAGWKEVRDHLWATRWKYSDMGPSATRTGPLPTAPPPDPATEEKLRRIILLGPGDEIAEQVHALREDAGIDFHFTARSYFPGMPFSQQAEVMDRLAEELLPAL